MTEISFTPTKVRYLFIYHQTCTYSTQ